MSAPAEDGGHIMWREIQSFPIDVLAVLESISSHSHPLSRGTMDRAKARTHPRCCIEDLLQLAHPLRRA